MALPSVLPLPLSQWKIKRTQHLCEIWGQHHPTCLDEERERGSLMTQEMSFQLLQG